MPRIFFSHSVTDRGTERSAAALIVVKTEMPAYQVVDPNSSEISVGHSRHHATGGRDFFKTTIQACDALAFLRLSDGRIGETWAQEIRWALDMGMPVYEIADGRLMSVYAMPTNIRTREDLWQEKLASGWM
jgi:hypothetical protein